MKQFAFILSVGVLLGCSQIMAMSPDESVSKRDSIKISQASLKFYQWYLECLNDKTQYNTVQFRYEWNDKVPILQTSDYFNGLRELGIMSESFINSESKRIQACQDALQNIDYEKVQECGCSVGEFYDECYFLEYMFWIDTQEKYDGFNVSTVRMESEVGICELEFYYSNGDEKWIDPSFKPILHLKRSGRKWLIQEIIK